MQKYYALIFTDKKGYELIPYNVEVWTQECETWK